MLHTFRIESQLVSANFPFRVQEFQVYRKLSEFKHLYHKLDEKYSKTGVIVPPPPRMTNINIFYTIKSNISNKWEVNVGKIISMFNNSN